MNDLNNRYILDDKGNAIPEPDLLKWAKWYEVDKNRIVKQEMVGDVRVSTVFLSIDSLPLDSAGKPVLWETMIFGGEHDDYQERYTSLSAAKAGHKKALKLVKNA